MKSSLLFVVVLSGLVALISSQDVIYKMPVEIDGMARELNVLRGQSAEMAVSSFAEGLGLMSSEEAPRIIAQLSKMLQERLDAAAASASSATQEAPLFRMELNISGNLLPLEMWEGQSVAEVIESFIIQHQIAQEFHTDLIPKLQTVIQQRLQAYIQEEAAQRRAPMFTLPLNLAGTQFEIQHYHGQDPIQEAVLFCKQQNIQPEIAEGIVPQIAQLIQHQLTNMQQEQPPQAPETILFTIPISINHQEFELSHYEGYQPIDSVLRFLRERGVIDAVAQEEYAPQLLSILQERIASNVTPQTPVFSIPLVLGESNVELHYYRGQNPEQLAKTFMEEQGYREEPNFYQLVSDLGRLLRKEISGRNMDVPELQPLFTLPITLNQTLHELRYFPDETPDASAFDFCKSRIALVIESTDDEATTLIKLNECSKFITDMITSVLEKLKNEQDVSDEILFTLDIDIGDGRIAQMPFKKGNYPQAVAEEICDKYSLSHDNVPALVQAIRQQMAKM